ncbi:MotA/TolQ/ExbB proton channel family protein [Prosthecodimorpha staleyi]|uniref:MotA/TolQ/ExbB proton channel family protein n=1 Tax=Prosthecodimorpha staleyi TaxID=2840188 RepID=A0A947D1Q8_9HYPH|nr:MotA/TolQ/ExbB proton channel family protein [Prosthecodimorpha staleyi]MBT9288729.1 MotA/TolQ/ExbB proton channel family protein [Prosthecodimorpha staleyi]
MDRQKVTIYAVGLAGAFALHLAIHGAGWPGPVLSIAALGVAGLVLAQFPPLALRHPDLLRASVLLIGGLALAMPLLFDPGAPAGGGPLGGSPLGGGSSGGGAGIAGSEAVLWPQILVAFFASRVLAAETEARFAAFWADPLGTTGPVGVQSSLAALFLGAALGLVFHLALPWLKALAPAGPSGILVTALAGSTALHSAIIVLFFVILAHLADALRLHLADAAALASLRRRGRTRAGGSNDLNDLVADEIAVRPSSRLLRLVADWVVRSGRPDSDAGPLSPAAAQDGFHRAARQFARGLVPFLPLLGFLGTVVGLAAAMAELPQGLGAGGGGADIAASLAGLAIKFETTLLGLIGSIVASLLIAVMERRETELAAEARRVVGALVAAEAVRHG